MSPLPVEYRRRKNEYGRAMMMPSQITSPQLDKAALWKEPSSGSQGKKGSLCCANFVCGPLKLWAGGMNGGSLRHSRSEEVGGYVGV